MHEAAKIPRRAWLWVFAAYVFQAIPAAVRDEALPVALKDLGYPDAQNTKAVATFGLIVGCKILLSPLVGGFNPRRFILASELGIAAVLALLASFLGGDQVATNAIIGCLILLSLLAAVHDFALDGYFVAALDDKTRATHAGILNVATKVGAVLAGPGLIWLVGRIMAEGPQTADAWSWAMVAAALLALITLGANAWGLAAEPSAAAEQRTVKERFREMLDGLRSLFGDPRLLAVLGLILFYRASEVHMARIIPLFSKSATQGGLGLDNETYAFLRMLSAVGGLALGGVIGSLVVARLGLGRSLLPLGVIMHLPLAAFAWLAYDGSHDLRIIGGVFIVEYVAYGAGLCALILAMMKLAAGPGAAVRYAALSTFALLANYLPGFWAGALAERLGYAHYFLFALSLAIPGIVSAWWAKRYFEEA
ncbi:MAG: MFS transporter [Opitutales bacterium]|jgi:PAT family beta-lactamase induction signal transducer AmpG